jgi:hypothetical protein
LALEVQSRHSRPSPPLARSAPVRLCRQLHPLHRWLRLVLGARLRHLCLQGQLHPLGLLDLVVQSNPPDPAGRSHR